MSLVSQAIKLYAWKSNNVRFLAVEGEADSRMFYIQLYNTSAPIDLTNSNVKFFASKPDSTSVYCDCTIVDDIQGIVQLVLPEQMTTVSGDVDCWIQVTSADGSDLRFEGMVLEVASCGLNASAESSDDMETLREASQKVDAFTTELRNARFGEDSLGEKIEKMDRKSASNSSRIDSLVAGATEQDQNFANEVIDARTDSAGTTHSSLGDALRTTDALVRECKSDLVDQGLTVQTHSQKIDTLEADSTNLKSDLNNVYTDYTETQYPDISKTSEVSGNNMWGSGYSYKPAYVKSVSIKRKSAPSDNAVVVFIIRDSDNIVLKKIFTKSNDLNVPVSVNAFISEPFHIAVRCEKMLYKLESTMQGKKISMSWSDTSNYQEGDTLPFTDENTGVYAFDVSVVATSLFNFSGKSSETIEKLVNTSSEKPFLNPNFTDEHIGDTVYCSGFKYSKGYIHTVTLNFSANPTSTTMILLVDSESHVIKRKILVPARGVAGKQAFNVDCFMENDFHIAVHAPSLIYQDTPRSDKKYPYWQGAWGTYGYYNEGDVLFNDFTYASSNIHFDISAEYDYQKAMSYVSYKRERIYTLKDAFRAWSFGEKFPIGIIGDSTTDGVGTSETVRNVIGTDYINAYAYPYLTQELLKKELGNNNIRIYNFGFSGKSASWALQNFNEMVWNNASCNDVKILIISHGINDYADSKNRISWYETYLRQLVFECFSHNVQPVIMTTQAGCENYTRFGWKQMSYADDVNRKIAEEFNLEIIDKNKFTANFNVYSNTKIELICRDSCHYNDYGHKYEAGMLFAHIVPRTIWCDGETIIGFVNEQIKTDLQYSSFADYQWKDVPRITPVNGFKAKVSITGRTDTTDITLMDAWVFIDGKKSLTLKTYCEAANSLHCLVDDVNTDITSTEQTISELDLGLHHIVIKSGKSANIKFYGCKLV